MSTTRLPELPLAIGYIVAQGEGYFPCESPPMGVDLYTADQMHAYGLAVWKAAMEAAHDAVADDVMPGRSLEYRTGYCDALHTALAAIRSLPLPEQGGPQ